VSATIITKLRHTKRFHRSWFHRLEFNSADMVRLRNVYIITDSPNRQTFRHSVAAAEWTALKCAQSVLL